MTLDVYVPADPARTGIDPGSGVVGTPQDDGCVLVDYEGNRHGAANIVTFADRVHHAAGRHQAHYPTVARSLLRADDLIHVGRFDTDTGEVDTSAAADPEQAAATIAAWCSIRPADVPAQLLTEGTARHQMRREVIAALASGDPARRFAARQMAQRHGIDI